jgi:hypothetical protein
MKFIMKKSFDLRGMLRFADDIRRNVMELLRDETLCMKPVVNKILMSLANCAPLLVLVTRFIHFFI